MDEEEAARPQEPVDVHRHVLETLETPEAYGSGGSALWTVAGEISPTPPPPRGLNNDSSPVMETGGSRQLQRGGRKEDCERQ